MNLILAISLAAGLLVSARADIEREGDGPRRAELNAMERHPLPEDLWDAVVSWSGDKPFDPADLNGRVVLVCTWARWYPQSTKVLPMLKEIREKHPEEELAIIAVHHERGFDAADAAKRAEDIGMLTCHDSKGKFRDLLKVDQDPDFYVIDRAGQLRYADIGNASVEEGVDELVAETRDEAESLNARLAEAARNAEERLLATDRINTDVDLREIPEVSFIAPEPAAYERARWPRLPVDENSRQQQEDPRIAVPLPEAALFPANHPSKAGRVVVLYFWHPDIPATHEKVIPEMDRLQRAKGRDVIVAGVLTTFGDQNRSGEQNPRFTDQARLLGIFQNMMIQRNLQHWMTLDLANTMLPVIRGDQFSGSNEIGPYAAVISSDGILRWRGVAASPAFKAAVEQTILVDPGVKARRDAEAEFIRTRGK